MGAPLLLPSDEEELIGDTIYGGAPYYQYTTGGPRARYLILMAGDSIFYRDASDHRWGWFTTAMGHTDCDAGHPELHDVNGDGIADTTLTERHCVGNGEFTLRVDTLRWNAAGTAVEQRGTLFRRAVAMLGTLGAFDSSSGYYHDVHVALNRTAPTGFSLTGDIRAGDYYLSYDKGELYPAGRSFTIAAGDTLWFQATYLGTGSPTKPWYGNPQAILTQFNFDHRLYPTDFHGGVNSSSFLSPYVETSPALWSFPAGAEPFRVVGRVVAPHHALMGDGVVRLADSISVTTIAVTACFSVTGVRVQGEVLTFDGHCASGQDTLEYRWTFGDGGAVEWTRDSVVAHHVYATGGTYAATLRVRRVRSTAPVDSTTQSLAIIGGPLWVRISGYDAITTKGTYTWTSEPHDGVPHYDTYRWYYQQGGSSEYLDGTDRTYQRYISAKWPPYTFRLRNTVQDAIPAVAVDTLWVDVIPGGGGYAPMGLVGLVDATGACQALPADRQARQAAHAAIARSGRWPEPCLVRAP